MKKSKSLLAALSVVAMTSVTACSKHKANPQVAGDLATESVTDPAEQQKQVFIAKLESQNQISANLQELINSSYGDDKCSSEEVSSLINDGTEMNRITGENISYRGIDLASEQLLKKTTDKHCQVSVLASAAEKAMNKYVRVTDMDDQNLSTEDYDKMVSQAGLIYSVIGPKLNKIKNEINVVEAEKATFAAKASYHGELESKIESALSTLKSQLEVLSCDNASCSQDELRADSFAFTAKKEIQQITGNLDQLGVSAADENIDAKNRALEYKLASLQALRTKASEYIKNLTGQLVATEEVGPNAKNGDAGATSQKSSIDGHIEKNGPQ